MRLFWLFFLPCFINLLLRQGIESLLADESLSHRAKLALRLRLEERRVLSACVLFCQQFRLSLVSGSLSSVKISSVEGDTPDQSEFSEGKLLCSTCTASAVLTHSNLL